MICLPSRLASPFALFSSIFISLMMLTACGGDTDETCGGNGVFHGDHCDCDAGFSPSADGLSCVADVDTDADTTDATNQNTDATDTSNATDLTFNASTSKASVGTNQDGSQVWIFEAMDGDKMLRLEFYAAYGAPTAPGVAEITDAETDYSTCGTCIMLRTGCVEHGDHYDCTKNFMPRAQGQIQMTAIGGTAGDQFAGELKDIVLQQVSIAQDYTTTPVAGGEELNIDSWTFDVSLETL